VFVALAAFNRKILKDRHVLDADDEGWGDGGGEEIMNFSKWVFRIAGIYGLMVLIPQYFLENRIGLGTPPAITHPEYFYGFIGVGLAFQVLFLLISADPVRLRPAMIPSVLEKLSFGIAAICLYIQGRLGGPLLAAAAIDLTLGALFIAAYCRTTRYGEGTVSR
jgi:hypothetical protein